VVLVVIVVVVELRRRRRRLRVAVIRTSMIMPIIKKSDFLFALALRGGVF